MRINFNEYSVKTKKRHNGKTAQDIVEYKQAIIFILALVLSLICFQVYPAQTLKDALVQESFLAIIAVGCIAAVCPCAFRFTAFSLGGLGRWVWYMLAIGACAGTAVFFLDTTRLSAGCAPDGFAGALRLGEAALICLLTGIYEESVFRILALRVFKTKYTLRGAVIASSVLFGLLHASFGEAQAIGGAVVWMQSLVKTLQAGMFGGFLAVLYLRIRAIGIIAGVHALFDFVYMAPFMVVTGVQPAFITGNVFDLLLLAATTILLFPIAAKTVSCLKNIEAL